MEPRSVLAHALRILAAVAAFAWFPSCSGPSSALDRVAPPLRFADLRETAAWTPGFEPSWWPSIDAAYAEYDRSIEESLVRRWDEVLSDLSRDIAANRGMDARGVRRDTALHREIDAALGSREKALIGALQAALPQRAEPFVGLLAARSAFHRAAEILREDSRVLPGPLEVLQSLGRRELSQGELAAAIASYARLAAVAREGARVRMQRFAELRADLDPLEVRLRALPHGESDAGEESKAARKELESSVAARVQEWNGQLGAVVESLRLALLREGAQFAGAMEDAAEREQFLDQLDGALHEGIRVAPGIRAFSRIARAAIERKTPEDADALAALDALVEREVARHAQLREQLRRGGPAARRAAYEALQKVGDPIGEFVGKRLEAHGGVWKVLERTGDVLAGIQSAEEAAASILDPPAAEPAASSRFPGSSRGELQILTGVSLDPEVLSALSIRLGLGADEEATLRETVERELERIGGRGERLFLELGDSMRELGDDRPRGDEAKRRVDRVMSEFARAASELRGLDQAANEGVLGEAARLAGMAPSDGRLQVARAELALLVELGVTSDASRIYEPITGIARPALSSPFALARKAAQGEEERDAAEALVLARADELLAAHREISAGLRKGVRDFMVFVLDVQGGSVLGRYRWDAKPLGARATALRLDIARELAAALGDEFGDRFLEAWLAEIAPQAAPKREPTLAILERLAADPETTASAAREIEGILGLERERRRDAIRGFLSWRGGWVYFDDRDFDSPLQLARAAPAGWLMRSRIEDASERALAASESAGLLPAVRRPSALVPFATFRPWPE